MPGPEMLVSPTTYEHSGVLQLEYVIEDNNSNGAANGPQTDSIKFELTVLSINTEPYF